jgi:hypothetical protein
MNSIRWPSSRFAIACAVALALAAFPARSGAGDQPFFTPLPWAPGGTQSNSGFAYSVGPAGDVNGDGFGDVIAGATGEDGAFVNEGGAYLYLGSAQGSSPTHAWLYRPGQANAAAGFAVASAGDVNGDGFADVLVSVHQWDTQAHTNVGKVAVFHGGPAGLPLAPTYDLFSPLPANEQRFGVALAPAGDVNGDGFADVIIGANFADGTFTQRGAAFVFHGGPAGLGAAPAQFWFGPMAQNSGFGRYLSSAGDINADGYADILVGADDFPNGGATFLYLGSAAGAFDDPDTIIVGGAPEVQCGSAISLAGDVDGDGFGDVLIGFPGANATAGRVELAFGGTNGLRFATTVLDVGPGADEYFGQYVATLGDLDGDGYADFGVGAVHPSTNRGRIVVYRGGKVEIDNVGQLFPPGTDGQIGESFGTSGDTDGDGLAEILVRGQNMSVVPGQHEGRAFQFRPPRIVPKLAPGSWPRAGAQPGTRYGTAVALIGPAENGTSKLVIGDPNFNGFGRISLHYGLAATGLQFLEASSITASTDAQGFGTRIVDAGDMNQDGKCDYAVSSPTLGSGQTIQTGRVDFHAGGDGLPAPAPVPVVSGVSTFDRVGSALAGRGDVNGDGFHDLLVGASGWDEPGRADCGKAFLFFGSPTGPAAVPWTRVGAVAEQGLGAGVALADLDADGYTDVILGSSTPTFGGTSPGKVEIHYGGPAGPSTEPGVLLLAPVPSVSFGRTVVAIGDVNADGIADLGVGAPVEDNRGVVRIYRGSLGRSQSRIPLATLRGTQDGGRYGEALAGGGDLDGDGIGDLVIGEPGWDGGLTDEGRIAVHFGARDVPEPFPGLVVESNLLSAEFGASLSALRDINGDAFADLVVGAPGGAGRVYPFLGGGGPMRSFRLLPYEPIDAHLAFHPARLDDPDEVIATLLLHTAAAGRARMRFQFEIVTQDAPFTGAPTVTSASTFEPPSGGAGPSIPLVPPLPDRTLKMRARWISSSPFFPRTRWIRPEAHASGDHDVWLTGTAVGVPGGPGGPGESRGLLIDAVSPNPVSGRTGASRIGFTLPRAERLRIDVFDLRGARVRRLIDEERESGPSSAAWDGRDDAGRAVAAGVYFVVLRAGGATDRAKLVRLP